MLPVKLLELALGEAGLVQDRAVEGAARLNVLPLRVDVDLPALCGVLVRQMFGSFDLVPAIRFDDALEIIGCERGSRRPRPKAQ
jgi:hypothetical protein